MSVRVDYDEEADLYRLVDDVDGVPITFAHVEGGTVRGHVENVKASQLVTPEKQPDTTETTQPDALVSNAPPAAG